MYLFPRQWNLAQFMSAFGVYEMIEKLNAIKRSKTTILRSVGLMTGLWDLKDIVNSRQNCSKNKLVGENAVA